MDIHHLIKMANQIGEFFESYPDHAQRVTGIAEHIRNFWEPRMRQQLIEYVNQGDGQLKENVREAVLTLVRRQP